jgi:hypothetical protein
MLMGTTTRDHSAGAPSRVAPAAPASCHLTWASRKFAHRLSSSRSARFTSVASAIASRRNRHARFQVASWQSPEAITRPPRLGSGPPLPGIAPRRSARIRRHLRRRCLRTKLMKARFSSRALLEEAAAQLAKFEYAARLRTDRPRLYVQHSLWQARRSQGSQ